MGERNRPSQPSGTALLRLALLTGGLVLICVGGFAAGARNPVLGVVLVLTGSLMVAGSLIGGRS